MKVTKYYCSICGTELEGASSPSIAFQKNPSKRDRAFHQCEICYTNRLEDMISRELDVTAELEKQGKL
jgi:hypothetical protein